MNENLTVNEEQDGKTLTHLGPDGRARMVDVSSKDITLRRARAACLITMSETAFTALMEGTLPKGDAFCVARLAGIQAAKKTADLIPLCHVLPLDHAAVNFKPEPDDFSIEIESVVTARSRTGVEMEALVAASTAALALYDMAKAVDKGMTVTDLRLLEKSGGRSGYYIRGEIAGGKLQSEHTRPGDQTGEVVAVSVSDRKGIPKENVPFIELEVGTGVKSDSHGGDHNRQVSLLAEESIDKIRAKGIEVVPGRMAENITTRGLVLHMLKLGTKMRLGKNAVMELTQIGKECHDRCAIYHQVGDCVMPREGVFAKVIEPGQVCPGDHIVVFEEN